MLFPRSIRQRNVPGGAGAATSNQRHTVLLKQPDHGQCILHIRDKLRLHIRQGDFFLHPYYYPARMLSLAKAEKYCQRIVLASEIPPVEVLRLLPVCFCGAVSTAAYSCRRRSTSNLLQALQSSLAATAQDAAFPGISRQRFKSSATS